MTGDAEPKKAFKKRGFYVGLWILLTWLAAAAVMGVWEPFAFLESDGIETVTHLEYGFSVDYPAKWRVWQYGENGSRGYEPIKMRIANSSWSSNGISIYYKQATSPTLDDVKHWAGVVIPPISTSSQYVTESEFRDEVLRGHPIRRGIFQYEYKTPLIFDVVYIARGDSMVVLALKTEASEYDRYVVDFEAIVASFRPVD